MIENCPLAVKILIKIEKVSKYGIFHDCRSPVIGDGGGFDVVAKINAPFETIVCYFVGEVFVFEPGENVPAMEAFQDISTSIPSTFPTAQGTVTSLIVSTKFARDIASLQPGDLRVNCFVEFIPDY